MNKTDAPEYLKDDRGHVIGCACNGERCASRTHLSAAIGRCGEPAKAFVWVRSWRESDDGMSLEPCGKQVAMCSDCRDFSSSTLPINVRKVAR